jgi:hypothetical protein
MHGKYAKLLSSFDCVISTPTTMALEAMLMSVPVIIDISNDGIHRTTAGIHVNKYTHLEKFLDIKNLLISKNIEELKDHLFSIKDKQIKKINYDISYFVKINQKTFADELIDLILKI